MQFRAVKRLILFFYNLEADLYRWYSIEFFLQSALIAGKKMSYDKAEYALI